MSEQEGEIGPLFARRLGEHVEARRATLESAELHLSEKKATVDRIWQGPTLAAEETGRRRRRLEEAKERLEEQRLLIEQFETPTGTRLDEQRPEARQAALVRPHFAAPGFCNVPITLAREKGCPLAMPAPAVLAERRSQQHAEEDLRQRQDSADALAHAIAAAQKALDEAQATHRELQGQYLRLNTELHEERARLARERAAIEEIERSQEYSAAAQAAVQASVENLKRLGKEARELSERKTARKQGHVDALVRLSGRFDDVVKALLGRHVNGHVKVLEDEIVLQVSDHGERDGAAMDTIKILAFDLAALALGIEGHGCFPGFLMHDGPHQADMDQFIYERLFLYATGLEEAFLRESPAFQYIVTTTAPPPERLRGRPWLLDLQLDASVREGRLLKEDL
jgi:hypothetical protein